MRALKVTPNDQIDDESDFLIDKDRRMVALEATWEISALAMLISAALDDSGEAWAVKEVMKRLAYLNDLIMTAVGDSAETTEELRASSLPDFSSILPVTLH